MKWQTVGLVGLTLLAVVPAGSANAAVVAGRCQEEDLRAAIAQAAPREVIRFDCPRRHTIRLTRPLIITQSLTLEGSRALTLDGGQQTRLIDVADRVDLTVHSLHLTQGRAQGRGVAGAGGAIRTGTESRLTIWNSELRDNAAEGMGGGAIFADHRSTVRINDSRLINNRTDGNDQQGKSERAGGAIAVASEGQTTVINSRFEENRGLNGGAINTVLGSLFVRDSLFRGNDSSAGGQVWSPEGYTLGYGGAIYTDGASNTPNPSTQGWIRMINSRFEENRAAGQGGGLFLYAYGGDRIVLRDSTVINNQVLPSGDRASLGGGIRHGGGASLTLNNVLIARNRATQQGGGLWTGDDSPVTMDRVTFWENAAIAPDGGISLGGAMLLAGRGVIQMQRTTIAFNQAGFQGGGIWGGSDRTTLTQVLSVQNSGGANRNGYNLYHHTGTQFTGRQTIQSPDPNPNDSTLTPDTQLLNPQLADFTDNGKATPIHPCYQNQEVAEIKAGAGLRCP